MDEEVKEVKQEFDLELITLKDVATSRDSKIADLLSQVNALLVEHGKKTVTSGEEAGSLANEINAIAAVIQAIENEQKSVLAALEVYLPDAPKK